LPLPGAQRASEEGRRRLSTGRDLIEAVDQLRPRAAKRVSADPCCRKVPARARGERPRRGLFPHVVLWPRNRGRPPAGRAGRGGLPSVPVPGEPSSLRTSGNPARGAYRRTGRRATAPLPEPSTPPPPGPLGATCDRATVPMRSTDAWSAPSRKSDGPYCALRNGSKTRWKLILGSDHLTGRRRHSLFHPKYLHLIKLSANCNSGGDFLDAINPRLSPGYDDPRGDLGGLGGRCGPLRRSRLPGGTGDRPEVGPACRAGLATGQK